MALQIAVLSKLIRFDTKKCHSFGEAIKNQRQFDKFQHSPRTTLMARMVNCIKLGIEAEGLDFPPYPGDLGKRLWEGVSKQAWADWMKHQTMLVNENRLNLGDLRARQYLARQMEAHFFGGGADAAQGYVPPSA
jgi:Fe-S cluster biosynthesis and repair protein YggX